MQRLKQRLEAAQKAYEEARRKLEQARHEYCSGPGQSYAETQSNAASLTARTTEQQQAHDAAKAALADAMLKSDGKLTGEVKSALATRRDTEDLLEQYETLKKQMERNRDTVHIEASNAARTYVQAYESASQRWAEMNVLSALVECGERIARAMAVVPVDESFTPWQFRTDECKTICCDRMIAELRALRDTFEGDASAYKRDIGSVDLGAFKRSDILTAVAISKKLRESKQPAS